MYYNNVPCVSAGILFYRTNKEIEYLMLNVVKKREMYEDAGGKAEPTDKDIWETAVREADEELNGKITDGGDSKRFINTLPRYAMINQKNKYVVFLVPYPLSYVPDFGAYETQTCMRRNVEFVPGSALHRDNINPRLRFMLKWFSQKSHTHTSLKKRVYDQ